jgi:hypothetical protein
MTTKNKKKKPSWVDVKKIVGRFEKKQLVDLVGDLYRLSSDNQDFFHARFSIGTDPLKSYKTIIQNAIHPYLEEHEVLDIDRANDAVENYSKAIDNPSGEAELMLFYVECGNDFTLSYGDIDEEFYDSLISMYEKAIDTIIDMPPSEQKPLKKRLYETMTSASGIGWGYYDELKSLFYNAFPENK